MHAVVENVDGVMPGSAESCGHPGRQGVVDEEVHASRGIMRSRTASAWRRAADRRVVGPPVEAWGGGRDLGAATAD
jgi:hypothetical protein